MPFGSINITKQGSSNEEIWGVLSFDQQNLDNYKKNPLESKRVKKNNLSFTLYVPSGLTDNQNNALKKSAEKKIQELLNMKQDISTDIKLVVLPDVFKTSPQPSVTKSSSREDKSTTAGLSPQKIVINVLNWIKGMKTNPKEKGALFSFLKEKSLGRTFLDICCAVGFVSLLTSLLLLPSVYSMLSTNLNQFSQILTLSRPLDILIFIGVALMFLIGVSLVSFSIYQMKWGANQVDSYRIDGKAGSIRLEHLQTDLEATFGPSRHETDIDTDVDQNHVLGQYER